MLDQPRPFMSGKQLTISILLTLYVVTIGGLTIYHGYNFINYIHIKGDETIYYMYFLLLTSILFQVLVWIITKSLHWKAAIIGTIVNFFFSAIFGFAVLLVLGIRGIPKYLIFTYGCCYITFFCFVMILQLARLRVKG